VVDESGHRTRYRLLETVRQYALERLGESGEANVVRTRHRDYYTALAALLDAPAGDDYEQRLEQADFEIDNLRAAFAWSQENSDVPLALALTSSLQPLWQARGRRREGLTWFDTALAVLDAELTPAERARALADRALLAAAMGSADSIDQAHQALAIAREVDDPALLAAALTACGYFAAFINPEVARAYFAEAIELARTDGDRRRLSEALTYQASAALAAGDPIAGRAAGQEGHELSVAIGHQLNARVCRWSLAVAQVYQGDLTGVAAEFAELAAEANESHDLLVEADSLIFQCFALAFQGEADAARGAADAGIEAASEVSEHHAGVAYSASAAAALAAGDVATALDTLELWRHLSALPAVAGLRCRFDAEAALADGALVDARRFADDAVSTVAGMFLSDALTVRARVAIAQADPEQAERDAYDALACTADVEAYLFIPDILECLGTLASQAGSHREAARLLGAAEAIRQRMSAVRFKIYDADCEALVAALRDAMGDSDFDTAWAEGAGLSVEEAIAYAQRGRGQRKRPTSGWASLTPTELDVVRLVSEGLTNSDIATRLFVSPRTVQTHLTHVYTKLSLTSRVQLAQEAGRHN
jgi:DNA-binding CsgD family transcriptional regulator